jgi:hypothetical protein
VGPRADLDTVVKFSQLYPRVSVTLKAAHSGKMIQRLVTFIERAAT